MHIFGDLVGPESEHAEKNNGFMLLFKGSRGRRLSQENV